MRAARAALICCNPRGALSLAGMRIRPAELCTKCCTGAGRKWLPHHTRRIVVETKESITLDVRIIMENDIQQGAMDLKVAVVIDEAQLAEFIHEEAHPRSRRADHFRQHFLADLGNDRLRLTLLAEICQDKKHPGQTL